MSVEIRVLPHFWLQTQKNNPLVLVLPIIELAPVGNNIPYISRVTYSVRGTPEELATEIKKAYKDFETTTLEPLNYPKRLEQSPCTLNQTLMQPVNCTLQLVVEYFDSDAVGNPLLSELKHIEGRCNLFSASKPQANTSSSQSTQPKVSAINLDLEAKLSALEQQISASKSQANTPSSQSIQPKVPAIDSDLEAKLSGEHVRFARGKQERDED